MTEILWTCDDHHRADCPTCRPAAPIKLLKGGEYSWYGRTPDGEHVEVRRVYGGNYRQRDGYEIRRVRFVQGKRENTVAVLNALGFSLETPKEEQARNRKEFKRP